MKDNSVFFFFFPLFLLPEEQLHRGAAVFGGRIDNTFKGQNLYLNEREENTAGYRR